jgi:hypothetical protein
MTNYTDAESDAIIAAGLSAAERIREQLKSIEQAKASQPERLAKARGDAEEARGWALLEEPLESQIGELAALNTDASLKLPNMVAKELWGARLAFDLLDADDDEIDAVTARLFTAAGGDTGVVMLIQAAALSTIASLIVPQLLDQIERQGSDWSERVRLCEARAKAWHQRVSKIPKDWEAAQDGVRPVDAFDIGSAALGDDER